MSVIRSILVFCVVFVFLDTSSSLYLGRPLGRGRGRGEKWRLGSAEGEGDGLRQWEDDRLDAIIATDEYIEDMEIKIEDLEEIEAEVIEELKDDEDFEGSGRYMENIQPPSGRYDYYKNQY